MEDMNLIEKKDGLFSKIKNWFKSLFGKNTSNNYLENELEFDKQDVTPEYDENLSSVEQIKYEFTGQSVSKQKLDKIRLDLDAGKIGFEDLYQLTNEELIELSNLYDEYINDNVSKLNEVQFSLEGYNRKLAKIQAQNQ